MHFPDCGYAVRRRLATSVSASGFLLHRADVGDAGVPSGRTRSRAEGLLAGALEFDRVFRAPTPMIADFPVVNRGTEWLVLMPPGLVSEIVVPAWSSAVTDPVRDLRTTCS
jgi:hypothetical protein